MFRQLFIKSGFVYDYRYDWSDEEFIASARQNLKPRSGKQSLIISPIKAPVAKMVATKEMEYRSDDTLSGTDSSESAESD
jgi:hypothetical protein